LITPEFENLQEKWLAKWPEALALWSKYTKLSQPHFCFTTEDENKEGLSESFAMIRLDDQTIVISLAKIRAQRLEQFPLEILGHEIGHHVFCPGDLRDQGRIIARMRHALPTLEVQAAQLCNMYADLFINDRLQRTSNLNLLGVYQAMQARHDEEGKKFAWFKKGPPNPRQSQLWTLYMRIYEILWSVKKGGLALGRIDERLEGDAQLGARLIRSYSRDWVNGAASFAALCLPHIMEDKDIDLSKFANGWDVSSCRGQTSSIPPGLTEVDGEESSPVVHPANLPELNDSLPEENNSNSAPDAGTTSTGSNQNTTRGQHREPFEYGAILKSLGIKLTDHEIAVRYYKERATPNLIRFPARRTPHATDPLPEGLEPWSVGLPLEEIDWLQSMLTSPTPIPGMTTLQRIWGASPGNAPETEPIDLDLYVDSSGSIPNPQRSTSFLTLAGAIICLSALKVGARIQVTLWSGPTQFITTDGFIRDEKKILEILTGYFGSSTAFPIHILRETFQNRPANKRAVHIMVISDEGVDTMFSLDERGNSGWDVASMALKKARAGGSLVLNLNAAGIDLGKTGGSPLNKTLTKAIEQGWSIHRMRGWEDLIAFAKKFSSENYAASRLRSKAASSHRS